MTKALEIAQVPNFLEANTTGLVVNAISYSIGSSFVANTTGAYHTGTVNAASYSIGANFVANSTTVNAASYSIGSNFIANTTGAYHTGTVNAASYTVGSNFVANTTAVGIGTNSPVAGSRLTVVGGGTQISGGTTAQEGFRFQRISGAATITGINNDNNAFNDIALYASGSEGARLTTAGLLQFNSGYGSAATAYGCRAWCKFNGALTGTNAPTAGGNISSITRNSTGSYTANFTNAMPDANYAVCVTGGSTGAQSGYISSQSTSSFSLITFTTSSLALVDVNPFYFSVFR